MATSSTIITQGSVGINMGSTFAPQKLYETRDPVHASRSAAHKRATTVETDEFDESNDNVELLNALKTTLEQEFPSLKRTLSMVQNFDEKT